MSDKTLRDLDRKFLRFLLLLHTKEVTEFFDLLIEIEEAFYEIEKRKSSELNGNSKYINPENDAENKTIQK